MRTFYTFLLKKIKENGSIWKCESEAAYKPDSVTPLQAGGMIHKSSKLLWKDPENILKLLLLKKM